MTFTAILLLGFVAIKKIPVSLMPDVAVPKITVQVNARNLSAREIENSIIRPLRHQLMQVAHLENITSETFNENGIITLSFEYGADINLAYIEVNEKIDKAMSFLPRDVERPKVIKASATDIPVFYLNLSLKADKFNEPSKDLFPVSQKFIELSEFTRQVIKKRIEQLPEVAIADISGDVYPEILIIPDIEKLTALKLTPLDIENALREKNVSFGNLIIRDGQYQYNVRFSNVLATKQDINNIFIKKENRLFRLSDFAKVIEHPQKQKGKVISDGKNAITIAIIKQSDVRMQDLKKSLHSLIERFHKDYPDIEFTITRDQTKLLDFSINNLAQSLLLGAILAFFIMFLFLRDYRSPLLIGITIPATLIISMLLFFIFKISINIISLSGLALGVGMIVDNSIIVIDNITQYREKNFSLSDACITGTNEVFAPMLSSVLTTCAVFIPLIYIGGIAGALFYDQAIAVTIGLFVSLGIAIICLPVFYRLFYLNPKKRKIDNLLERINRVNYHEWYERSFLFIMKNRKISIFLVFIMLISTFWLYNKLPKEKLPAISKTETLLKINWNEKINIDENYKRTEELISNIKPLIKHYTSLIGEQQFIMNTNKSQNSSQEVLIYLETFNQYQLDSVVKKIKLLIGKQFNKAVYSFEDPGNIFTLIFSNNEPMLLAKLRATGNFGTQTNEKLQYVINKLKNKIKNINISPIEWEENIILKVDPEMMILYDVNLNDIYTSLKRALRENVIFLIMQNQNYIPVVIGEQSKLFNEILSSSFVINRKGEKIRLSALLKQEKGIDLKRIIAGEEGEYYPIVIDVKEKEVPEIMQKIRDVLREDQLFEVDFAGRYFTSRELIKNLTIILLISIALLYFILASQFESLILPFIVLAEIPIDIFGAFLMLKLTGHGINLMSLIGIVVMSGIVINDSILKIDTINHLISERYSLMYALKIAGQRRLKPIIMTSLTTILALIPVLFFKGMGNELQRPLALTMIGGMTLGTIISLYFIPLIYYYIKKIELKMKNLRL